MEVKPHAVPAEREPCVSRDRADLGIDREREGIEARRAVLDLAERERSGLELEARMIEEDLLPDAPCLVRVTAVEVEVAGGSEERREGAEAQVREVDEVEDEAVLLAWMEPRAPPDALGVEPFRPRGARHRHARDARVVEPLRQDRHVAEHLGALLPEVQERLRADVLRHHPVDDPRGDPEHVQRAGEVPRVAHRHAERDRAPIARELLDRTRDESVALLDVDDLSELLLSEVETAGREPREIGRSRDAIAAQRREVTVLDHLREIARVDDALEDGIEALAVATRRGRREAEQRPRPVVVERAELT